MSAHLYEAAVRTLVRDAIAQRSDVPLDQVLDPGRHLNLIPIASLNRIDTMCELESALLFSLEEHGTKDIAGSCRSLEEGFIVRRSFTKSTVVTLLLCVRLTMNL